MVSPLITHEVAKGVPELTVQVAPPGDAVAVYEVMSAPPLNPGAAHDTVA